MNTITIKQLDEALFYLSNQNMTVKELREMLFNAGDQVAKREIGFQTWLEIEQEWEALKRKQSRHFACKELL